MGSLVLTRLLLLAMASRIRPVYGALAQPCASAACSLPSCRCAGLDIPGGLAANDTPQMITISFDDAVRVIDHEMFFKSILAGRKNPNGCDTRFTFFVSHDNTDYALLQTLAAEGHEMASHSITHRTELSTWWHGGSVDNMTSEIVGMQDMMRVWGGVTRESIKGWRTPFLATSENQIRVLYANNFTYESSMQTPVQYWPFTLDYKSPLCETPATCPVEAYPGLWVIPNIRLLQANNASCGMLDSCTHPQTQQQVYDLLVSNFNRHYNSNRAPFGIYLHAAWFFDTEKKRLEGLMQFLDYAATFQDTYIVTHTQLLEWVRSPTPLSEILDFKPWKCPSLPPPSCSYQTAVSCVYPGPPWMQFKSCAVPSTAQCPIVIPGIGDILGTNGSEPSETETMESPPCNPEECQLPNCHCAGTSIPGGLAASDTPQMVTFGFFGSLQAARYDTYYSQALVGRTNPNGCSIPATFFVSNAYTNYALVESLAAQGHEIADYSVTARSPSAWWREASIENLTQEIVDMKDIIIEWSNVPENNIRGFRTPFRASSENVIRVLHDNDFQYDASMETSTMYWPFTLDYKSPICTSPATCPDNSYPGLWILPNIVLEQNGTVFTCGELDICLHTVSKAQWLQLFKDNFHRHYDGNRAPFSLYTRVSWFYYPERVQALQEFLDYVANFTDTYFVTHLQLLDWVRSPTPLSEISNFESWKCPSLPPPRCDYQRDATSCSYTTNTGTEHLELCAACPTSRPGLGNPLGEDPALSPPSVSSVSATDAVSLTRTTSAPVVLIASSEILLPSTTSDDLLASITSESISPSPSESVPPSSSKSIPPSSSEGVPPSSSESIPSSSSETAPPSSSETAPPSSSETAPPISSEPAPPSSSESIQSSFSKAVSPSSSETAPPSSSESVPPSSSETAPPSSSESVPPSSSETAPPSSSETAPPSSSETAPPSSSETVSPSSSETAPPSSSETAPPSSSETVSPSSSETAPPSSSETAPPSSSETVSPSSSETAPPSSSETAPPSSSETAPPSSSEPAPPSSSERIQSSSSKTVSPSSSERVILSSSEDIHTSSETSASVEVAVSLSDNIVLTTSMHLSPSASPTLTVPTSAAVTPSRSATGTSPEGSTAGLQADTSVGLAVGVGVAVLAIAAASIAAATALVAYLISKKRASYAAIKEVSTLHMEFLSNPSSGAALA